MTTQTTKPAPLDAGNGTEALALSTGALNIREDVLQGFLAIRQQHQQLEGILHQMMRRVVLPRCKEIGDELDRIRSLYPNGKKGPGGQANGFFSDAERFTSLKKAQVLNYITIATGWHRLMDFMADLPEGAAPIQSMRGALEALRAMNRPERPALPGSNGAVDVDAEQVQGSDLPGKRTSYASSTRKRAVPALEALLNTEVGRRHEGRIRKVIEAVDLLLRTIEEEEAAAAPAEEWSEPMAVAAEEIAPPQLRSYTHPQAAAPAPAPTPPPAAAEEPAPEEGGQSPAELFPRSTPEASYAAMSDWMVRHGGGGNAAKAIGCADSTFRNHRSLLKKLMQEQGEA